MTSYSGKIIRKTPLVPTQASASGVWTVDDAAAAVRSNTWPVAGVPDPISRSVRLRSAATAYFNRTPAIASNRKTWTWSGWVKRSTLGAYKGLFGCQADANNTANINFDNTDKLYVEFTSGGAGAGTRVSSAVYRDVSAWYHIVVAVDTTLGSNRIKMYVNGVETAYSSTTEPSSSYDTWINSANIHYVGRNSQGTSWCIDGYMAEVNFIDGQALTPSSFGTTNAFTGAWIPMAYTGTYGTNGFYLNFKDNTSTTTLGYDYSGNANNWTATNISLTAGETYDSMLDVPTPWVGYSATTDTSAVTRGNYSTINPLAPPNGVTISNANLNFACTDDTTPREVFCTFGTRTGKWYFEATKTNSW